MQTPTYLLFTCLLVAAAFHTGDATKCYTCTSATDAKCADPMTPEEGKAVQCTSDALKQVANFYNTASKQFHDLTSSLGVNIPAKPVDANLQCSKIDISDGGDKKVTIRGCSMPPTENFDPCKSLMEKYASDKAQVSFCSVCNTDYCNGASAIKVTAAFLLPLLAILISNYQ